MAPHPEPSPPSIYELFQKLAEDIPKRFEEYVLGYTYSLPKLALQAIVMVFAFYGMLVNARSIKREVYSLLPPENKELAMKLLEKAGQTLHNLLRSWLVISILKGILTSLGFILFGLAGPGGAIAAVYSRSSLSSCPSWVDGWSGSQGG